MTQSSMSRWILALVSVAAVVPSASCRTAVGTKEADAGAARDGVVYFTPKHLIRLTAEKGDSCLDVKLDAADTVPGLSHAVLVPPAGAGGPATVPSPQHAPHSTKSTRRSRTSHASSTPCFSSGASDGPGHVPRDSTNAKLTTARLRTPWTLASATYECDSGLSSRRRRPSTCNMRRVDFGTASSSVRTVSRNVGLLPE